MAEGEVLETNRLGGEKRNRWGDCENWPSKGIAQDCALSRQAETLALVSLVWALGLLGASASDGGGFRLEVSRKTGSRANSYNWVSLDICGP
jgi:hypothetical protein